MRLALALFAVAMLAGPAVAAPASGLARPDARVTVVASDVEVGALLTFLAAVGGSAVTLGPEVPGPTRSVNIENARVQDAFDRLLRGLGLQATPVGGRLVIGRRAPSVPATPTPPPVRPELLLPPVPGP